MSADLRRFGVGRDRAELVAVILRTSPELSNREVARLASAHFAERGQPGLGHPLVSAIRDSLVSEGAIEWTPPQMGGHPAEPNPGALALARQALLDEERRREQSPINRLIARSKARREAERAAYEARLAAESSVNAETDAGASWVDDAGESSVAGIGEAA